MSKRPEPHANPFTDDRNDRLMKALNSEEDSHCIVVTASYLDYALATLLGRTFRQADDSTTPIKILYGALGSFEAKAELAYSLALVPKNIFSNLHQLAQIRNLVAHRLDDYTFDHGDIAPLCRKLKIPAYALKGWGFDVTNMGAMSSKEHFINACLATFYAIEGIAERIQHAEPLSDCDWDHL